MACAVSALIPPTVNIMLSDPKRPRILVVEDDYCIGVLFETVLSPLCQVVLTDTFDGALQAAARRHFNLFLLDIYLGETRTGIDLLSRLRQIPGSSTTRAVACTSFSGEDNRKYLLSCGFNGYVCKPFTRRELLSVLARVLADEPLKGSGLQIGIDQANIPLINDAPI